ncbi:hypothetical protein [Holzapfeliella floricola]|uniref:Uncharacterized protein n=1 Tax=Holzapfeliella floricola DSM 23037 = JCM 16512 TaxID=1423744 RepID=A0A0R2DRV2_9LACO|nr:hypothetical protein [Holzapfeliella floricola]KRN04533.1 hypothetical protein FC86_GL000210 [Holzapfeliella floricola DSM 23037 = JCM 16512]
MAERLSGKSYALFFDGLYGNSSSALAYLAVLVPTIAIFLSSKDESKRVDTKFKIAFLEAGLTSALAYLIPAVVLAIIASIVDGTNGVPQTLMFFSQIIEISPLLYLITTIINFGIFEFVYGCLSFAITKLFNSEVAAILIALAIFIGGSSFAILVIGIWEFIPYMPVATFTSTNLGTNLAEFSLLFLGSCLIGYVAFRRQMVKKLDQ